MIKLFSDRQVTIEYSMHPGDVIPGYWHHFQRAQKYKQLHGGFTIVHPNGKYLYCGIEIDPRSYSKEALRIYLLSMVTNIIEMADELK